MAKGWRNDWERHAMARYGIKSAQPKAIHELKLRSNRLPVKIGIVVPSTNYDRKLSPKEFKKRVTSEKRYFSELFGGETAITEQGGYIAQEKAGNRNRHKLIEEKGTIVEASTTPENYEKHKRKIANHIRQKQRKWKQQTVGYSLQSDFYIYPKKPFIASSEDKNVTLG